MYLFYMCTFCSRRMNNDQEQKLYCSPKKGTYRCPTCLTMMLSWQVLSSPNFWRTDRTCSNAKWSLEGDNRHSLEGKADRAECTIGLHRFPAFFLAKICNLNQVSLKYMILNKDIYWSTKMCSHYPKKIWTGVEKNQTTHSKWFPLPLYLWQISSFKYSRLLQTLWDVPSEQKTSSG